MKTHSLRCRCGILQGVVQISRTANRALCYCADCQAYARFLDASALDTSGGTEVVAMTPRHVRFVSGLESLACLSLSPRGLLRWYAQCCRTPIGNTPRNHRLAYVGLMHCCLGDEAAREASFGPVRIAVNTKSARGPVPSLPFTYPVRAMLDLTRSLVGARLSGSYRQSPFFDTDTHAPVRKPLVLSKAEREAAYADGA